MFSQKQPWSNVASFQALLLDGKGFRFIWRQIKLIMVVVGSKLLTNPGLLRFVTIYPCPLKCLVLILVYSCYALLQFSCFITSSRPAF